MNSCREDGPRPSRALWLVWFGQNFRYPQKADTRRVTLRILLNRLRVHLPLGTRSYGKPLGASQRSISPPPQPFERPPATRDSIFRETFRRFSALHFAGSTTSRQIDVDHRVPLPLAAPGRDPAQSAKPRGTFLANPAFEAQSSALTIQSLPRKLNMQLSLSTLVCFDPATKLTSKKNPHVVNAQTQ